MTRASKLSPGGVLHPRPEVAPRDPDGWRNLAVAAWRRGEVRAALDLFDRALGGAENPDVRAEYQEAVRAWGRSAVLRPAWRLGFRAGPAERPDASRLGGLPARAAATPWPVCGHHRRPLAFLAQLNLGDAPGLHALPELDLVLLFRCHACADADPRGHVVELLRSDDLEGARLVAAEEAPSLPVWERIPAARATLEPTLDLPDWQELPDEDRPHALAMLGAQATRDDVRDYDAYVRAHQERFGGGGNLFTSKLGGWPHWVHRAERPRCPSCTGPTGFVAQLDAAPELGLDWGKSGCAYVFRCAASCSPSGGVIIRQML